MDNETSKEVEDFILSQQKTRLQYTAPDRHCHSAEKGVQTYKATFKSILASLPKQFPIAYWCRLLTQTDLSVNIVRPNRQNPLLSAWASMEGELHFDATPVAPPGSEMLMHQKPGRRKTFGLNAIKVWYLGPCLNHYRTFRGILPSTGAERLSDTVKFQHHAIGIPEITSADRILEAARQLDAAICEVPEKAQMDTLEAIQSLREVMLGETLDRTRPQRVPKATAQKVHAKTAPATKTWYRVDRNAKAFLTTKTAGPLWSKVTRRVTLDLSSAVIIEDLKVNKSTAETLLHRLLPAGTSGTCTILYHNNGSVANMEVPTIQPQRVVTETVTDTVSKAQEPNYISDDDNNQPVQRRRSPRLEKSPEDEQPDRPGNAPHRILALVAAETAVIPDLAVHRPKLIKMLRRGESGIATQRMG